MFERFTEKGTKAIMLAQEEARRLGHNFVGTEQILLGLMEEGTGVAATVLRDMGVNLEAARIEVEKIIGRGSGFVAVEIPFTPRAKRVLELSQEEADRLGCNYISTEHLLLGLIQEGEGVAVRVLENLKVVPTKIQTQVMVRLGEQVHEGTPLPKSSSTPAATTPQNTLILKHRDNPNNLGTEPLLPWLFSRQDIKFKIFPAVASLLLLLVGGLTYREISFLLVRNRAYEELKAATKKQDYPKIVKAAQTFLAHPPLIGTDRDAQEIEELSANAHQETLFRRAVEAANKQDYLRVIDPAEELLTKTSLSQEDPRYQEVKKLYAQALIQWSAQQKEDALDSNLLTHLKTYKSLN